MARAIGVHHGDTRSFPGREQCILDALYITIYIYFIYIRWVVGVGVEEKVLIGAD